MRFFRKTGNRKIILLVVGLLSISIITIFLDFSVKFNIFPVLTNFINPWYTFDNRTRWTDKDYIKLHYKTHRRMTQNVTKNIDALKDIDYTNVIIVLPRDIFDDVMATVLISPKPTSDILHNKEKIESIQNLIKDTINKSAFFYNIKEENIVIIDNTGLKVNDF